MLRLLRGGVYFLTSVIGVAAFLTPLLSPSAGVGSQPDSPLLLALIGGLCLVALLLETQADGAMDAKFVALLGILVSINAVLSFLETAIPGPGGFSPVFFLILLTGYVFGARFGFLMGALTLFVSSMVTGGIGPWLPFQMLTAGWVGLSAPVVTFFVPKRKPHPRLEVALLALWGLAWGLLFGAIMNLWFWPYATGPVEQSFSSHLPVFQVLQRYVAFYVASSLVWDAARGIGTAILLLLFGIPTLKTLRRFYRRFAFTVTDISPEDGV